MSNILQAVGGALGSINPLIGAGLLSGIGSLGASSMSLVHRLLVIRWVLVNRKK